mgnify:CR=1 FL=1
MIKSTHNIGQELVAACHLLDIDPETVLRQTGLERLSGNYEALYVTPKQLAAVYEALGTVSGKDDFHITLANGFAKGAFGSAFLAMQCSETLRDGIYRAGRFKELFEPIEWKVVESDATLSVHVRTRTADFPFGGTAQVICFLWLVQSSRNVTAKHIVPKRVCVTEAFAHQRRIEQEFDCPVEVADRAFIEFDNETVAIRSLSANRAVINGLDRSADAQQRESLSGQSFLEIVHANVQELLPSGVVTSDRVARSLSMSKRTLERRLAEQGSSFTKIVRDCRTQVADHYLCQTHLSLTEIGFLLGYRDINSFYRAFKSWHGRTAQEMREQTLSKNHATNQRTAPRALA